MQVAPTTVKEALIDLVNNAPDLDITEDDNRTLILLVAQWITEIRYSRKSNGG